MLVNLISLKKKENFYHYRPSFKNEHHLPLKKTQTMLSVAVPLCQKETSAGMSVVKNVYTPKMRKVA